MNSPQSVSCPDRVRRQFLISGVVQGVGFRPYIYRLAHRFGVYGFVQNTATGAHIEVEGTSYGIDYFVDALPKDGPPLMQIHSIQMTDLAPTGEETFSIRESEQGKEAFAWVPPDIATCELCVAEIRSSSNRRFEYPFTNCTNCGPRYSIIVDVPYDRSQTTMAGFPMCEACRKEYEASADRRFHAQPIACPDCGPHLWLVDSCGKPLPLHGTRPVLEAAANLLRSGGIVAWKGLGGYQLACDGRNVEAVQELRRRKRRHEKAFAVMVRDIPTASSICEISNPEQAVLKGPEKPIVLLRLRSESGIAHNVAPGNSSLGVMLPYTPMHQLLFDILEERCGPGSVLVMTSGNMAEEPIAIEETEVQEKLKAVADVFVHHNRPIHTRVDDSVVRVVEDQITVLRRARGYAPAPLPIGSGNLEVLACGAQQKSTFCLTKGGHGFLSQHLGDLENFETLSFFGQTLERMQRLLHIAPTVIAHDLHPGYLSTQFAKKVAGDQHVAIQHHHAHIASCMVEHGLTTPVIGVAWDGTGYGTDGKIWGSEFLVADLCDFERFAHFRYVPLAGGDIAMREPWRVARSYLQDVFDDGVPTWLDCHRSVPETSVRTVDTILQRRIHTIETSSCGRLFDAVSSILNLYQTISFEGQAAMAMETIADSSEEIYDFLIGDQLPAPIDLRPMIRQIANDIQRRMPASTISAQFHNTLVAIIADVCGRIRRETGLNRICLSGGSFQNVRLLRGCLERLRANQFDIFFQQRVPTNDGGISLGQAAIACKRFRRGL